MRLLLLLWLLLLLLMMMMMMMMMMVMVMMMMMMIVIISFWFKPINYHTIVLIHSSSCKPIRQGTWCLLNKLCDCDCNGRRYWYIVVAVSR